VLEQLADKQRREFEARMEHAEERQREEAWQGGVRLRVESLGLRAREDLNSDSAPQPSTLNPR
jgi:hypothetical protein